MIAAPTKFHVGMWNFGGWIFTTDLQFWIQLPTVHFQPGRIAFVRCESSPKNNNKEANQLLYWYGMNKHNVKWPPDMSIFKSLEGTLVHLFYWTTFAWTQWSVKWTEVYHCGCVCCYCPGGYKGYGLGMMVEVFCGILAGAKYSKHVRTWKVTDKVADLVSGPVFYSVTRNIVAHSRLMS